MLTQRLSAVARSSEDSEREETSAGQEAQSNSSLARRAELIRARRGRPPGVPSTIFRKAEPSHSSPASTDSVAPALASTGRSLPRALRSDLEHSIGSDLSSVTVHTGDASADASRSVGARAFAVGQQIHFSSGGYDPSTTAGRHLIAHEVAHTVQQRGSSNTSVQTKLEVSAPGDSLEREADSFADAFSRGEGRPVRGTASGPGIYRTETGGGTAYYYDPEMEMIEQLPIGSQGKGSIRMSDADAATALIWQTAMADASQEEMTVRDGSQEAHAFVLRASSDAMKSASLAWLDQALLVADSYARAALGYRAAMLHLAHKEAKEWKDLEKRAKASLAIAKKERPKIAPLKVAAEEAKKKSPSLSSYLTKRDAEESKVLANRQKKHSVGELGRAKANQIMIRHRLAVEKTGKGTHSGERTEARTHGKEFTDCITFAMEALGNAFRAAGKGDVWKKVLRVARQRSKNRYSKTPLHRRPQGLSGIDLQTALVDAAGWTSVQLVADTDKNTAENKGFKRHLANLRRTRSGRSLYGGRGARGLRPTKIATDYAPDVDSKRPLDKTMLERLKRIPFGFISVKAGGHTGLLINGQFYEAHAGGSHKDFGLFEATPLERWNYKSGILVAPKEDVDAAWKYKKK